MAAPLPGYQPGLELKTFPRFKFAGHSHYQILPPTLYPVWNAPKSISIPFIPTAWEGKHSRPNTTPDKNLTFADTPPPHRHSTLHHEPLFAHIVLNISQKYIFLNALKYMQELAWRVRQFEIEVSTSSQLSQK